MSKEELKRKYKTLRNFAALSGIPITKVYASVKDGRFDEMMEIAKNIKAQSPETHITEELRDWIRSQIRAKYGAAKRLCEVHPEFDQVFISSVVTGRTILVSRKTKDLINVLG